MQGYWLAGMMLLMVVLLVRFQGRSVAIFGGAMLVTLLAGWIDQQELLSNASNSGLATLIMLVIVSFALEKTSLLRSISRRLFSESETASILKTISFTALASSVLNNTAVVAAMLNSVRNNRFVPASKLLIPMSYAAIIGGTLTLIGTSTNLIVNSMLTNTGHPGFKFFDFTLVGAGVTLGGLATLYIVSRFLPSISPTTEKKAEYFVEAELDEQSPLIGNSVEQAGLRHLEDLFLAEIIRDGKVLRPVARYDVLQANDKLLFSGDISKVQVLKQFPGLDLFADKNGLETQQLTEVVIREDSVLVGKSLKSSQFRARFDAAVVAIRRDGERVSGKLGEVRLRAGDFLLLATGSDFASRTNLNKNFYLLSGVEPDDMLGGWREKLTLFGFLAMIAVTVIAGSSLFISVLCLLALLLVTGCLKINEVKRRFPVEIWVIVASALCLASAMQNTGLDLVVTEFAQRTLAGEGVWLTFIGVFLLTYLLTEIITNNAAAALMFPVAYSLAVGLGVDPFPMVMAVAFAASASFISPYGYQTNLMVFNASNYRLKHFVLAGIPVALVYCALAIWLIPRVFPF